MAKHKAERAQRQTWQDSNTASRKTPQMLPSSLQYEPPSLAHGARQCSRLQLMRKSSNRSLSSTSANPLVRRGRGVGQAYSISSWRQCQYRSTETCKESGQIFLTSETIRGASKTNRPLICWIQSWSAATNWARHSMRLREHEWDTQTRSGGDFQACLC